MQESETIAVEINGPGMQLVERKTVVAQKCLKCNHR